MALIDCPECGHEVSSSAATCPNCGHPLGLEGADLVRHLQAQQRARGELGTFDDGDRRARQLIWAWVIVVSGVGLAIGSLLPWATITAPFFGTINVTGTQGDGVATLIIGLIVAVAGVLALTRGIDRFGLVALFVALVAAGFVAFTDLVNINDITTELKPEDLSVMSVGIGLWLVSASVVVGLVGAGGLAMNRSANRSEMRTIRDGFDSI